MSRSILIVEDDRLIASFIEKGLRGRGYSTEVASDGIEAERLLDTGRFDLLILDMALPRRSGFEVLTSLRAAGSRIPVLVLTGRPELRDDVTALGVAAGDFMTKPFRFDDLLARVRARLAAADDEGTDGTAGAAAPDAAPVP